MLGFKEILIIYFFNTGYFELQKKDYSYEFYDKNNTLLFKNLRYPKNSKIYYSLFEHGYYTC